MNTQSFDATPSKDFFIDMLTRDIPLEWAILDLIDNSVDGAREQIILKGGNIQDDGAYEGFEIIILFNKDEFVIKDNCGGFSKQAAEDYAFKFGRPADNVKEFPKNSVGRFGVGMKRGIFKIGGSFIVETKHEKDHFIVDQDIEKWRNSKGWTFNFKDVNLKSKKSNLKEEGTFIKVTKIRDAVSQDFQNPTFNKRLIEEIQRILSYSIKRGLKIRVNNVLLEPKPILLLTSENLVPYYYEENIEDVNIKIFAGIGPPDPNEAGWYIFCNDRLMVEKDKTNLTGWEGKDKLFGDSGVQKYHNKVAMFRGIVFFSSENSSSLPMTTTKSGIDFNSTIYKTTRSNMINAMQVVLSYLNGLQNSDQRDEIVKNSMPTDMISYDRSKLKPSFTFPSVNTKESQDNLARISYKVDREVLSIIKKSLNKSKNEDVGIATFNYYVDMKELL